MNEDRLKYNYKYIYKWGMGLTSSLISDYMVAINPECKIKDVAAEMLGFDPDPNDTRRNSLAESEAFDPYTSGKKDKKKGCENEESLNEAMEHLSRLKTELDKVLESPDIDKYPGIRSVVKHFSELSQRALDGRDIANEISMSPAGEYHSDIWVDFVNTEHGGSTMEQVDKMIQDFHFEEMGNTILDNMDCINDLKKDNLTVNERATIKSRMENNAKSIVGQAEYLCNPENIKKYENMFHDAYVNVAGDRGITARARSAASELEAMNNGWDVKYARDYEYIKDIVDLCKRTDQGYEKLGSDPALAGLKDKANVLAGLDPVGKVFKSEKEFADYFQSFSNASRELLEEAHKPEVQQAMKAAEIKAKEERRKLHEEEAGLNEEKKAISQGKGTRSLEDVDKRIGEIKAVTTAKTSIFDEMIDDYGGGFVRGSIDYFSTKSDFNALNIDSNSLNGNRIDYSFLSNASRNVGGMFSPILRVYQPVIGNEFFSDDMTMMSVNMQQFLNQDHGNHDGPVETDLYSGQPVIHANTTAQKAASQQDVDKLLGIYKKIMDNPGMQQYKGIRRYMQVSVNMMEAAKAGVNRYAYMNKVPGGERIMFQIDWKDTNQVTGQPLTPEDYEEMISGMQFDKMYDLQEKLCDIQIEMDQKYLTPEEKAAYGSQITEINNQLIDIHEHQMSNDSKEKYGKFYEDFDSPNHGNVSGSRGYHGIVRDLKAQNELIAAGWDPTKVADYNAMKQCVKECQDVANELGTIKDPDLAAMREKVQKITELNPTGRKFGNQREFQKYSMQYSMALKDIYAEVNKPEIQSKLFSLQNDHGKLKTFIRSGDAMGRGGTGKAFERFEALAKQTDITFLPASAPQEARAEANAIKSEIEQERYKENILAQWDKAKERYQKLNNPEANERTDSRQYETMKSALEEVSKLPKETDIEKVRQALGKATSAEKSYATFMKDADGIDKYKAGIESVRTKAQEQLEQLRALGGGNRSQSFRDMKSALEEMATIPKGASLEDLNNAIKNVKETAANYAQQHSGYRFSKAGRMRQQLAQGLSGFADNARQEIKAAAADTVVEKSPDMSTYELMEGQTSAMEEIRESDAGLGSMYRKDIENAQEALDSHEPIVRGKDELSAARKADLEEFQKEGNKMSPEKYANSLSRIIAGKSLQMQVNKGKMKPEKAAGMLDKASKALQEDKFFKDMVKEAMNNPKAREEMGNMEPGEMLAKMAHKKVNENMEKKAVKMQAKKQLAKQAEQQAPGMGVG